MKNKLSDLNNHLFAQLERLGNEDITEENLEIEVERSKAITNVAKEIVVNAKLAFEVEKFKVDHNYHITKNPMPEMLEVKTEAKSAV